MGKRQDRANSHDGISPDPVAFPALLFRPSFVSTAFSAPPFLDDTHALYWRQHPHYTQQQWERTTSEHNCSPTLIDAIKKDE